MLFFCRSFELSAASDAALAGLEIEPSFWWLAEVRVLLSELWGVFRKC